MKDGKYGKADWNSIPLVCESGGAWDSKGIMMDIEFPEGVGRIISRKDVPAQGADNDGVFGEGKYGCGIQK